MKVFISWSGEESHQVGLIFRDWLPSVIQNVDPYLSSEDIDKGVRWSTDISKELEKSAYGIICVTKTNLEAPWLNFEAGALSKSFEKSRVSPFLFGVKRVEVKGPLLQFQSTTYEKKDILKLLQSINSADETACLDEARLEEVFKVWWPSLKEKLDELLKKKQGAGKKTASSEEDKGPSPEILEEILELVRTQQKLLRNPEALFPPDYVKYVLRGVEGRSRGHPAFRSLRRHWMDLNELLTSFEGEETIPLSVIREYVEKMSSPLDYIFNRYGGSPNRTREESRSYGGKP